MPNSINNLSIDWKSELNQTSFRFHTIVAWVAVILNPLFAITDYFIKPDYFLSFFVFRVVVTVCIMFTLIFRQKLIRYPHLIGLVPYIGISAENAYMYSVMNVEEVQQHTFSYIVLFIGAGMFAIWHIKYSIIAVLISYTLIIAFYISNSNLTIDEFLTNGVSLTITVALMTIPLIQTRTNLTRKEIISRLSLAESKKQLEIKNSIIEEKNKDIQDSLHYSQGIQQAILPTKEKIEKYINDYFIYYKPKDIVSGDFYWFASVDTTPPDGESEKVVVIAAVDCTGHGVPGALMSIIGSSILNQSIRNTEVNTPAQALNFLDKELSKSLNAIKDGMDISLIAINTNKLNLQYAGANNPAYIVRKNTLIELHPDKSAIGGNDEESVSKKFTNHSHELEKGDIIYLFTDGYADQFGGPKGKKFKHKQLQELFLSIQNKSMNEQKMIIETTHHNWKGELEQVDDILIIGIRV